MDFISILIFWRFSFFSDLNFFFFKSRFLDKINNANEIAPYQSKCKDYEWRMGLKVGDEIDGCDTAHVWYNATILDVRENQSEDGELLKEI